MLEAITDFWKPVKKSSVPVKLSLKDLQIGGVISFGYVPQLALNGRKFTVTAINTYQFGQDVLTSFVLSNDKDIVVSMIIAEAQGEQYLAISRLISVADRSKLFDSEALKNITLDESITTFKCRDNIQELKNWLVGGYKREIYGMRGFLHRADFRNGREGLHAGEEFQYTLLGSNSNEHAIEIESYTDGRVDVYATIYRRTSDISEIIYSDKLKYENFTEVNKDSGIQEVRLENDKLSVEHVAKDDSPIGLDEKHETAEEDESKIIDVEKEKTEEFNDDNSSRSSGSKAVKLDEVSLPYLEPTPLEPRIEKETTAIIKTIENNNEEKSKMSVSTTSETRVSGVNGAAGGDLPYAANFLKDGRQEINTVTKTVNGMDNESVECDLRVANHVIDEAIRNEMRLSDVVRRIIELPVSHQEAVQIPINLSDEDYSLLAIRYGIPSSDRNAIKLRIIQDLTDFSGSKKKN